MTSFKDFPDDKIDEAYKKARSDAGFDVLGKRNVDMAMWSIVNAMFDHGFNYGYSRGYKAGKHDGAAEGRVDSWREDAGRGVA